MNHAGIIIFFWSTTILIFRVYLHFSSVHHCWEQYNGNLTKLQTKLRQTNTLAALYHSADLADVDIFHARFTLSAIS